MKNKNISLKIIDEISARIGKKQENIVSLLHAIQKEFNYLPLEALQRLSEVTEIPVSIIAGVSSFYSQFRLKPAGQHHIRLCVGTACHLKGAQNLYEELKRVLKIGENEDTDGDGIFTINRVACLGCCMLAPVIMIDDIIYGPVEKENIASILKDFLYGTEPEEKTADNNYPDIKPSGTARICLCSSCAAAGAGEVFSEMEKVVRNSKLSVRLETVGCTGISFKAPLLEIETAGNQIFRYGLITKAVIGKILETHFAPGKSYLKLRSRFSTLLERLYSNDEMPPVTRYLLDDKDTGFNRFLCHQTFIATKDGGQIPPLNIEAYMERGGFSALSKCLKETHPEEVIKIIEKSGLRGRGGAGFETCKKWSAVKNAPDGVKYLICNGDEGDPGAFMDRMLMESFPFRVLEGLFIAAYACNIEKGYIFVRAEYPLACERLKAAINICREKNIISNNPLNKSFRLDVELIISAGAFVCGEETAMIASIEGKRGTPRLRPPYPSVAGLWGRPTLVNNVETLSLVPWIILNGTDKFLSFGTQNSKGTKTFALAGKIENGGLIEVPMGTPLRKIIFDIGGGCRNNKAFKAVQIGGPSGGCLPAELLDREIDFESLKDSGAIMGSGGMIVLDEDDCIVDTAKYFMSFTQNEACGKCTFGRIGTKRILEVLIKLTQGKASDKDLLKLHALALSVKENSLCGLCGASPNPVLTAMRYFEEEFREHSRGICRAKKCKALIKYVIGEKCIGCTKCAQRCPVEAIPYNTYFRHEINQSLCIRCDTCRNICPEKAITIVSPGGVCDKT